MNVQAIDSQDITDYFMKNQVGNIFFWIFIIILGLVLLLALFGKK